MTPGMLAIDYEPGGAARDNVPGDASNRCWPRGCGSCKRCWPRGSGSLGFFRKLLAVLPFRLVVSTRVMLTHNAFAILPCRFMSCRKLYIRASQCWFTDLCFYSVSVISFPFQAGIGDIKRFLDGLAPFGFHSVTDCNSTEMGGAMKPTFCLSFYEYLLWAKFSCADLP